MTAAKTVDQRDVIDAVIRIKRIKSRPKKLDSLVDLLGRGLVDRSVLEAFGHSEFMRGWCDGVADAIGENE